VPGQTANGVKPVISYSTSFLLMCKKGNGFAFNPTELYHLPLTDVPGQTANGVKPVISYSTSFLLMC